MNNLPLTPEQISSWNNDGIILLRNVLTPEEISSYRGAVDQFLDAYESDSMVKSTADAHGKEFFHILNIISYSDKFDKFIDHEKIFDVGFGLKSGAVCQRGLRPGDNRHRQGSHKRS